MTRMTPLTAILLSKLFGGGGSVTAAAVLAAMEAMDSTQAEDALDAIGGEPAPTVVTDLSSTSITLEAAANTVYNYGTLTSLTISSFPAQGKFWIWFTSGATATTTVGIANFTAEANKKYRIFVENGYATYDSWATS